MSERMYKATRPDGTDFFTGTIDYAAALASGEVIRHRAPEMVRDDASTYLSVSVSAADCTGFSWPCRLFSVEPVGTVMDGLGASPSKRACSALRVVEELPSWWAFGPNGEAVVALLERLRTITPDEACRLAVVWAAGWDAVRAAGWDEAWAATWIAARVAAWAAARAAAWAAGWDEVWDAVRDAVWDAAWAAGWDEVWDAVRDAVWDAARAAARAIIVRDLITPEQFDTMTGPWVSVMGETWA